MSDRPNKNGFTLIEVVISIAVLSLFIGIILYLYSRSNESFKITLWKQERTAQANLFWSQLRKNLEEATNDLSFSTGTPNPVLTEILCPLKFHPTPTAAPDGNILAWNVTKTSFVYSPPYNHSGSSAKLFLVKEKNRLTLRSGAQIISSLDDVLTIEFKVALITNDPATNEEIIVAMAPDAVGSLLEIAIVLAPPDSKIINHLRIPQNHKFRLNVIAHSDSAPSY